MNYQDLKININQKTLRIIHYESINCNNYISPYVTIEKFAEEAGSVVSTVKRKV